MKILKLLLVLGLLFKTIDAEEIETINETDEKVSFSVAAIWLRYHKKETTCPAKWAKGVQEFYDGVRNAVDDVFKSSEARKMGDSAVTSLGKYLEKLVSLTHNNSTLVTSCVTSILTSLSTLKNLKESGLKIIIEFDKALPAIINNYNKIARSLSAHIGDLTSTFTNDVSDAGKEFSKFQKAFIRSCQLFNCQKKVDYTPVQKQVQKLCNTLALINETLLKKCERASQETHEAVMILDLMYVHLHIAVTGINSCALDEMYRNECHVSKDFKSVSHSFETALIQITEAVCAITFPLANSIKELLSVFVNIVLALNESVKAIFGVVEGLTVTVGEITQNLLQGLELSPSVAKDKTNILKGLTRN